MTLKLPLLNVSQLLLLFIVVIIWSHDDKRLSGYFKYEEPLWALLIETQKLFITCILQNRLLNMGFTSVRRHIRFADNDEICIL